MKFFPVASKKSCLNGRTSLSVNLDYANDFMRTYKSTGFFGLMFIADYSHASSDHLNQIDTDLYDFLFEFAKNEAISNSTILILFSDHGPRFTENRKSMKGLLEERNPFYSIYLPSLFRQRYVREFEMFHKNADKLITPMDIHRTLSDLISMEKKQPNLRDKHAALNRSQSMFSDSISVQRTCAQAGIDEHWCACLKRTQINVIDSKLNMLANKFINYLNSVLLNDHLDSCAQLELSNINHVFLLDSIIPRHKKAVSQSFSLSRWFNNLLNNLFHYYLVEPPLERDFKQYLFQVVTRPNNATYEFTVVYESNVAKDAVANGNDDDSFEINHNAISRIDKYGDQPKCIKDKYPDLRKFCFCI